MSDCSAQMLRGESLVTPEQSECLKCGMCCRTMFVFIRPKDLAREPRLIKAATRLKNHPDDQAIYGEFSDSYLLAAGWAMPCPFLGTDNLCMIYETRADICRNWQPNIERCQKTRKGFALEQVWHEQAENDRCQRGRMNMIEHKRQGSTKKRNPPVAR